MSTYLFVVGEVLGADGAWHALPPKAVPCRTCAGAGVWSWSEPAGPAAAPGAEPAGVLAAAGTGLPLCPSCEGSGVVYEFLHEDWRYHGYPLLTAALKRGLPTDLSAELRQGVTEYRRGLSRPPTDPLCVYQIGATCGWLSLAELLDYSWPAPPASFGYVSLEAFEHWEQTGTLHETPHQLLAAHERYLAPEEARRRRWHPAPAPPPSDMTYVTRVPHCPPGSDPLAEFLQMVERDLWPLGAPDAVRIVFHVG